VNRLERDPQDEALRKLQAALEEHLLDPDPLYLRLVGRSQAPPPKPAGPRQSILNKW